MLVRCGRMEIPKKEIMKTTFRSWRKFAALALVAGWFFGSNASSRAQAKSTGTQTDSIVAVVADSQGLPFVPAEQRPFYGTFWIVRNSVPCVLAPSPCPPLDPNVPVYALSSRQFLVDETAGQPLILRRSDLNKASSALVVQMQVDELLNFVAWIQAVQLQAEMRTLVGEGPPIPGEGGGSGGGGPEYSPIVYGTNDLWLEAVSVTNSTANFTIHTPDLAAYDLFGTTNLSPNVPGLNLTNWVWLLRTDVGQTNIVLTNLWPEMGFFRLGTMQDTDNDGLTDAYEKLVSHTNPNLWDTDGDGLSDGWEVAHGMNPLVDESAQTSGRVNYQYDAAGWLTNAAGIWNKAINLDAEGNVKTISQ